MSPVAAPHIACRACGRQTSHLAPLCRECDDELPPVIGERYVDVLREVVATSRFAEPRIDQSTGRVVWPGQDYQENR